MRVAEQVDAKVFKTFILAGMWVRVPSRTPLTTITTNGELTPKLNPI